MTTDTKKLRDLLAKGTRGEWAWWPVRDDADSDLGRFVTTEDGSTICWFGNCETYYPTAGDEPSEADAALIVAAVNALPALLDEVEGLRAERDRMRKALEKIATIDRNPTAQAYARTALGETK